MDSLTGLYSAGAGKGNGGMRKAGRSQRWLIPLAGIKKGQMCGSVQGAHNQPLDPQGKQINLLPLSIPSFTTTTTWHFVTFGCFRDSLVFFRGCFCGEERFKTEKIRGPRGFWSPDFYHEIPCESSRGLYINDDYFWRMGTHEWSSKVECIILMVFATEKFIERRKTDTNSRSPEKYF